MPRPKWRQVRQFCEAQRYERDQGDHTRYIKLLADGSSSGTMISHGKDGVDVPPNLWRLVWQTQLRLTSEEEFWKGLAKEVSRS